MAIHPLNIKLITAELIYKPYINFSSIHVEFYANYESMIYSNSRHNAPQEKCIVINYSQSVGGMLSAYEILADL